MRSVTHLGLTAAALILSVAAYSQTPSSTPSTPAAQNPPAQSPSTPADRPAASGQTAPPPANTPDTTQVPADIPAEKPIPGHPTATPKESKDAAKKVKEQNKTDTLPSPGQDLDPHIKPGSEDDVNAVGTRNIGGRGVGNWYSTDWEIRNGKAYSMEIEKSAHLVTDPVIVEYVNRVGQNIVKNSDCKVPFTIKVIDSDEINAMALPGGFFYVNSGLIMAADEEAELAGVMAHETAHVCAHHAARQMTKMNYAQIGSIPLIIFTQGTWTGYGIYEATQLAIPITFLKFSRM
ncbi:MAG TPA: M48 family metalloprotease, partial [Edaphobacter sp.]|nr:M48 family metalloprotease [Edaphobacter sp.]